MQRSTKLKTAIALATCALGGAVAGIAGAAAAPSTQKARTVPQVRHDRWYRAFGPGAPPGMPVHEDAVVLNRAGTAYIAQTEDNGTVDSVSGNRLTLTEGTKTLTYKTVTLSIPDAATIYRNGSKVSLSALAKGDHVHVIQSSDATVVIAGDGSAPPPGPGGPGARGAAGAWGPGGAPGASAPAGAPAPPA